MMVQEFELFGEAGEDPGEAAGPGGEGGVALLGGGAAVAAVVGVEDGFVDDAAGFGGFLSGWFSSSASLAAPMLF